MTTKWLSAKEAKEVFEDGLLDGGQGWVAYDPDIYCNRHPLSVQAHVLVLYTGGFMTALEKNDNG
jgi:hypothetical protein|tara:strand:- start:2527 stop:2721 length:195 start_codon:yes stop_codon:yes gene_type:complete